MNRSLYAMYSPTYVHTWSHISPTSVGRCNKNQLGMLVTYLFPGLVFLRTSEFIDISSGSKAVRQLRFNFDSMLLVINTVQGPKLDFS